MMDYMHSVSAAHMRAPYRSQSNWNHCFGELSAVSVSPLVMQHLWTPARQNQQLHQQQELTQQQHRQQRAGCQVEKVYVGGEEVEMFKWKAKED